MIQDPEDDRLDQSLRDTFSDFDLPPARHVWSGIEGRLSAQPGPPRPVPLKLLLPVVGLVGLSVGWLLPRPTDKPAARPASTVQVQPQSARVATEAAAAYVAPRPTSGQPVQTIAKAARSEPAPAAAAKYSKRPLASTPPEVSVEAVASLQPTAVSLPVSGAVLSAAELVAALPSSGTSAIGPAVLPVATATNSPLRSALGTTTAAVHTKYAADLPRNTTKGENLREWRPEYRTPKHRTAERGLGLRRFRNHITKQWQQLFSPRRSRNVQPAS